VHLGVRPGGLLVRDDAQGDFRVRAGQGHVNVHGCEVIANAAPRIGSKALRNEKQ
jgi:hypothetical protein